jgi:DNA-binding transcriptional LysR family regulator
MLDWNGFRAEGSVDRLAAMQAFVRVVETGSFTMAARALDVGQPSVSKSIAQLETSLGVRLLARSTRGVSPTEAGLRYYDRAKRALEEADEAEAEARGASAALTGRLRVSGALTFVRLHVIPKLEGFLERHPGLSVDFVLQDPPANVIEDGADIGLLIGDLPDSSLVSRKLGSSPRAVIGTGGYFERAGMPGLPSDLVRHDFVAYDHPAISRDWVFRRGDEEVAVSVSGRIRSTAAEAVRAAVQAGLGVTIASELLFAHDLDMGAVQVALADWTLPSLDLWACFPTGRMPTAKARAFADFCRAVLNTPHSEPA